MAGGGLKGVVNGVLRNFLRQRESLLAAATQDEVARYWFPPWWLARLRRTYRDGWQGIVTAGNLNRLFLFPRNSSADLSPRDT